MVDTGGPGEKVSRGKARRGEAADGDGGLIDRARLCEMGGAR